MALLTENFLRGRRRDQLSDEELLVIEHSIAEVRQLPARKTILKAGDQPDCLLLYRLTDI